MAGLGRDRSKRRPDNTGDLSLLLEDPDETDEPQDVPARSSVREGIITVFQRNRMLWIVAAAAVLSLVAGLLLGRFLISPADAAGAAELPAPGLVTVPVQYGQLSNDVTIRGEVAYADPVEVRIDTTSIAGPAVVTGQVPEVGSDLKALSIALEIAGRPVIVLPGELPAYRSLYLGVSGPDVMQFKTAVRTVGIDAGDPADPVFGIDAANAVSTLYATAGYSVPELEDGSTESLRTAQESVRMAEQGLLSAQSELAATPIGATPVEIREADNAVAGVQRELTAARQAKPQDPVQIGNLVDALELAELRRQEVGADRTDAPQRAAVDAAAVQLTQTQEELARAEQAALPALPAGEVLYLADLPRRVDAVATQRGSILEGASMTVSGATLGLSGSAAEADARLLTVEDTASFDLPDGTAHSATITAITPGEGDSSRWTIQLQPAPLTPEQIQELQGTNVRVSIAVGATDGEVLSVPYAALTAGPGGETRVEVAEGDPRDGEQTATRLVVVRSGLATPGAVEITPVEGTLAEGDLVVVGK